jgi:CheY-like chemotaxis protein
MIHADWARVALVVDDEAFARLHAAQILLDQGFIVLEAADAAEGLATFRNEEDVSLVLTDISMPGALDGLDLAQAFLQERPDMQIIVASGQALAAERLPAGATFLAKPYTAYALLEAIRAGA